MSELDLTIRSEEISAFSQVQRNFSGESKSPDEITNKFLINQVLLLLNLIFFVVASIYTSGQFLDISVALIYAPDSRRSCMQ